MPKVKVSNVEGAALDWAVAQCEGIELDVNKALFGVEGEFAPSTDWAIGGPIIQREKISVCACMQSWFATDELYSMEGSFGESGPTPLIAAMRCYVARRFGGQIDIPEELCANSPK